MGRCVQLAASAAAGELLPLRGARGGPVAADRIKKQVFVCVACVRVCVRACAWCVCVCVREREREKERERERETETESE